VKNASIVKPAGHSAPKRLTPSAQEVTVATCDPFARQGMQNRAAEDLPPRLESPSERPGTPPGAWERPTNATLPPYSDEYAELEQHLYTRGRLNGNREVINDLADQNWQPPGKRGAEPGWLPDDELTRDWLRLVQEYRSECDASDRRRLLDEPATGEAAS
jgi:hypothetical protein